MKKHLNEIYTGHRKDDIFQSGLMEFPVQFQSLIILRDPPILRIFSLIE